MHWCHFILSAHGGSWPSKELADRTLGGEFIDLAEVPPTKEKVRPLQSPKGGVLFVSTNELL